MAKKARYKDPQAAREADRYENPIASRELILQVLNEQPEMQTFDQMMALLNIHTENDIVALERRLKAMIRDGQLRRNRAGLFGVLDRMDLLAGRVQSHRDGYGFLIPDQPGQEDLYLSAYQMRTLMDGDRVMAAVEGRNRFGKVEARIVEITERAVTRITGTYRCEAGVHLLMPHQRRFGRDELIIADLNGLKPRPDEHVLCSITQYPASNQVLLLKLEELIARSDDAGMEIEVALRSFDLPYEWPEEVQREAEALPDVVQEKDKKHRHDLRDLPLVTIDGEDARDFDDAVYVEAKKRGGWRLVVAIADVTHYVKPGAPLDVEAHLRGTSVYFPRRVIPMLPEKLSNGLCSLNPHQDRLCLFCDVQISAKGRVTAFQFGEGVIRSRHRLTYTQVGALIEHPESAAAKSFARDTDSETLQSLSAFHGLYQQLAAQREQRGAIDFDTIETKVIYGDDQKITAIVPAARNVAHRMIEEAMLCANICAAKLLEQANLPTLYRNHEPPKQEKLETLQQFIQPLGLSLNWNAAKGEMTPKVFAGLSQAIQGRPDKDVIQVLMLRSLKQAKYEAENRGHFGLAYDAYAHFTSPIRRYPDVMVHRGIRYLIQSGKGGDNILLNPGKAASSRVKFGYDIPALVALGEHSSMAERRADEASRDVVQWLKCQYMQQHIGEEFEGIISGVTSFGLFVQLKALYVEGLVHVANLTSDYFRYDDRRHALVGESSNRIFALGGDIRVLVAAVNIDDRKIDLMLAKDGRDAPRKSVRERLAKGEIGPGREPSADKRTTSKGRGRSGKTAGEHRHGSGSPVKSAAKRGEGAATATARKPKAGKAAVSAGRKQALASGAATPKSKPRSSRRKSR